METANASEDLPLFMPSKRLPVEDERSFKLASPFKPAGDQPQAIEDLTEAIQAGETDELCD